MLYRGSVVACCKLHCSEGKTARVRNKTQYSGEPWPKSTATSWRASPLFDVLWPPLPKQRVRTPLSLALPHSHAQISIINYYCSPIIVAFRYSPPLPPKITCSSVFHRHSPRPVIYVPGVSPRSPEYGITWQVKSRMPRKQKKHSSRFHFCPVGYDENSPHVVLMRRYL